MKILAAALVFVAFLSLFTGTANAQTPEFTIWTRVIMPEGYFSRQSGLEVRLERPGRMVLYSLSTDEDGRVQFRNLEEGEYYLYMNLEGFAPVLQQVILRRPAQVNVNVTIHLRRGGGDAAIDRTRNDSIPRKEEEGKAVVIDAETLRKFPPQVIREYEEALKEVDSGKSDKAVERLTKLVRTAPDYYDAHMQLGLLLQRRARYGEAEKAFAAAMHINSKAAQPVINLAGVYLDRARLENAAELYDKALEFAEKAIEADPESAEAQYYLGSALFKLDNLTAADDALRRAVAGEKPMQEARLMMVNVYMKQRRYRDALDQLDKYLEANPDSPQRSAIEQMQAQIRKALNF
jgi:tetratricopeptide (TPR) repeat protein